MSRPRWLAAVLARVHEQASQGRVRFTLKAFREIAAFETGLDENDALHVLASLTAGDFVERMASRTSGEWMYVFNPRVGDQVAYVKLIVRADCVVISFHEEEGQVDEDD